MSVTDSDQDTVNKKLLYLSKTQPDKPAFIFHNPATTTNKRLVFTRADIFTLASRYAAILCRKGIRQGDVVCNTLPNSPERLLTDLGIMLAGAVAMNGMVVLSDGADFVGSIQKSGCVAVIVDPRQKLNQPLTVLENRLRSRAGHTVDCPDTPLLKTLLYVDSGVGQDGHKPFLEQLRNENESFVADVKPEERALIFITSGSGQPVRKSFMQLIGKVTQSIVIFYASTECGPVTSKVVTMNNKGDYEDGNNGLPLPGVELQLVDENQQEVLEPGQTGEVLCRGPNVFTGYLGMDQAALGNVFTHDGWFRTTDVGFRNSKGELHIVCRKSNAIMYGHIIVYPGWLESRLARCSGVQSVVIVPVPDPIMHQELCACVVPQPAVIITEAEIREFCKTLYIDPESEDAVVPRYCVMFDSFPTTVTGKTDRKAILTSALRTLGMTQPTVVAQ
nr:hypothetical protein BaRGS_004789 [Batillaria attramentaria]